MKKTFREKITLCLLLLLCAALLAACGQNSDTDMQRPAETELPAPPVETPEAEGEIIIPELPEQAPESGGQEEQEAKIQIEAGGTVLLASLEDNPSAEAFLALLQEGPITVKMSDYAGMEKVGPLGTSLLQSDSQISVGAGDVILYQGNQITIYYGTNSWNFTKLAHIDGATEESLLEVLGTGDVEVTFSIAQA